MPGRGRCWFTELPLNEVVFDFYDRLKSVCSRLCQFRLCDRIGVREGESGQNEHCW